MKKAASHKKKHSQRHFRAQIFIFSGLVTVLAIIGVLFYQAAGADQTCANSVSCIKNLSGEYEEATEGEFMGKTVPLQHETLAANTPATLGEKTDSKKHIYVDLTNQRLYAYDDNVVMFDFPVSTGKWNATPTGDFRIWIKLPYTRMTGGNPALGTYYNLPNVPFTMYFYNADYPKTQGFGIHGAYWHNNFGHPMSHGCVNMKTEDVEKLYNWADPPSGKYTTYATAKNPGTLITIYGEAPLE